MTRPVATAQLPAPPAEWDATEAARKLMSCIYRCEQASGFGFGAMQIIDVLTGHRTAKVEQYGHDRVSTFGIGKELSALQWRAVIRQLVALRLLRVDYDRFNVLKLTADAREVLSGRRSLKLRKPAEALSRPRKSRRAEGPVRSPLEVLPAGSEDVFHVLREWRKGVAKEHGVPAYTVFHDATLQQIARVLPSSLESLRGISGVGATKLERYGEPILKLIRDHAGHAATALADSA